MNKTKKVTGRALSIPVGVTCGSAASLTVTILAAMVLASLMQREAVGETAIGGISAAIVILSAAIGAIVSYWKVKHRRLLISILTGCGYYVLLLGCTALFFGGAYQGMGVTGLAVAGGSLATVLLGGGEGKSRPAKKRKKLAYR